MSVTEQMQGGGIEYKQCRPPLPASPMTHDPQSLLDLIELFTWPSACQPDMQSAITPFADPSRNPVITLRLAGQTDIGTIPSITFEQRPSVDTSVALNGSVLRNDPGLARAASNVARWKTYLPQDCVTLMMSEGWHWTT
jgi:hypothetical protein